MKNAKKSSGSLYKISSNIKKIKTTQSKYINWSGHQFLISAVIICFICSIFLLKTVNISSKMAKNKYKPVSSSSGKKYQLSIKINKKSKIWK